MDTKIIAALLAADAAIAPPLYAGNGVSVITFKFDNLRITCPAYSERIMSVSEKFRKGFRAPRTANSLLSKPSLRRTPDGDAVLAALEIELG